MGFSVKPLPSGKAWPYERIQVPEGSFHLGSMSGFADEKPVKSVRLSAYYLAKTPVTIGQYRRYLTEITGRQLQEVLSMDFLDRALYEDLFQYWWERTKLFRDALGEIFAFESNRRGDDYPIVGLSWSEARAFCHYYQGDLPTAAQRERAAKGKSGRDRYGTPIQAVVPSKTLVPVTGPAALFRANDFGFVDLCGNVWEWTLDRYLPDWYDHLQDGDKDPHNALTNPLVQMVEVRGGCFKNGRRSMRSSSRSFGYADQRYGDTSFRPAWPLPLAA